ncbi:Heterokaryon incompatibility protein 6, OR allele [Colletotrichum aenigma]|uniref:Heterokaryon incompatibility protein 6, OR allele n=1 Tax=Colletotrichum aenigma TaxID=1215731 RepID=UPI001872B592|nr:Heterokaryon incompatibility protein 6, OR allele [Colletotrichum aenigma]KAF5519364.1 Heterokaryon incompatibility protein 6, OR allele [Colletotrichum aenigma]
MAWDMPMVTVTTRRTNDALGVAQMPRRSFPHLSVASFGALEQSAVRALATMTAVENEMGCQDDMAIACTVPILESDRKSSLRQEKPFLWLCIVAVSQAHTLPQAVLNDKIRSVVAQRMVLNLERSLELLQGLLICIAWGNFQVHQRPFLTLFTQLANTVVFDLGLNQPPQTIPEAMLRLTIHRPWLSATHTVEEQRALIASYYLSSIVSSYMRRTDKLLWTPYMSTCLDELSSTGVPGDLTLESMVKIRKVLEKAFYSPPNSNTSAPETPSNFVALVLKSELNELTTEEPCPAESLITSCHLTYAPFAISEFAFSSSSPDPQYLYNTYQALESYFNALLPFQPSAYPGFTLAELYQMMHATLSLRKLSFRLTTRVYDEDRVEKLASWYRQSYIYQPLPRGFIRLLRLKPHEDADAPLQCELFHYPLTDDRKGTHLYEALSYCWGPPSESQKVFTGTGYLQITANLHAALARLRDPFLERVIWVDAICINQKDADEKGHQVQLMAEIYARASGVVVWLEEVTGDTQLDLVAQAESHRALQVISLAVSEAPTATSGNVEDGAGVAKLLNRNWFNRIWTLHTPGVFSLGIRALGELIDLYHTRNATDRRDKIYALLGTSTDAYPELKPDYRISWKDLFCRLVRTFVPEAASVSTWNGCETAFIQTKGRVLGTASSVETGIPWDDAQTVNIVELQDVPGLQSGWIGRWTVRAAAKRAGEESRTEPLKSLDHSADGAESDVNFLLIWDWEASRGEPGPEAKLDDFLQERAIDYAGPSEGVRLREVGLLYSKMGYFSKAIDRFDSAIEVFKKTSQIDCADALAVMDHLVRIYRKRNERGDDQKVKAIQKMAEIAVSRRSYDTTEASLVGLASFHDTKALEILLDTPGRHIEITDNVLAAAASNNECGGYMMDLLLDRRDEIVITENVLKAAVGNPGTGSFVLKLLFERKTDPITVTEDLVWAAARQDVWTATTEEGEINDVLDMLRVLFSWKGCNPALGREGAAEIFALERYLHGSNALDGIYAFLLGKQNGLITITEDIVEVIVNRCREECDLTDRVLVIWRKSGNQILSFLTEQSFV